MNTETKKRVSFTPGPWEVHSFGSFDTFEIHKSPDEDGVLVIADITSENYGEKSEREANARLIPATPQLYEALRAALPILRGIRSLRCKPATCPCDDCRLIRQGEAALKSVEGA